MNAGGTPGLQVSWQVTGVRHDPWADANRQQVEQTKPPEEQNLYLNPELYGLPPEQAVHYQPLVTAPTHAPEMEPTFQPN